MGGQMTKSAIVYGLKNCDSCRKAVKALQAADFETELKDVRADPLDREILAEWVAALGDALVNRRSPTWRALDDAEKAFAEAPEQVPDLLISHPTVMKRPVIVSEGHILLGWSSDTQTRLGL